MESPSSRGSQINPGSRFVARHQAPPEDYMPEDWEAASGEVTTLIPEYPRQILNEVASSDLPDTYSVNPYQGCEHGCVYCYARPTHEYYGYSAGKDFETHIHYKPSAPELLESVLNKPSYRLKPLMLSGNTDCYQPSERKLEITRRILEICLRYRHPLGIITKNRLILRDLDLLHELAGHGLVHVNISLTTFREGLRRQLEPRTVSGAKRLDTLHRLSLAGVPVRCLMGPVIPFLNSDEMPEIYRRAAEAGALDVGYILVRLNGTVKKIFEDWLQRFYPDKAQRVLAHIAASHGGSVEDYRPGIRMQGEGPFAENLAQLHKTLKNKFFQGRHMPDYNLQAFAPRAGRVQTLF